MSHLKLIFWQKKPHLCILTLFIDSSLLAKTGLASPLFLGYQGNRVVTWSLNQVGVLLKKILTEIIDENPISDACVNGDKHQDVRRLDPCYFCRRRLTFRCPEQVRPGHVNGKATAWFSAAALRLLGKTNRVGWGIMDQRRDKGSEIISIILPK